MRFIVPFTAGGGTDLIGRVIAQRLGERFGQQVVVDNRPGAGTVIGSDIVARSTPDGHTLLLTANPHTSNPALIAKLPYDTLRDFAPVTMAASAPLLLAVHPSLPARNVRELIELAKAKPGQLSFASSGNGGPQHLAGALFNSMTGISLLHVPYKGGAPATTDLIGGQVPIGFTSLLIVQPHVKAGRLQALAVTSSTRARVMPEVPTIAESGVPGYECITWYGIFVAGATPAATVATLNAAIVGVLKLPDVTDRLTREGSDVVANTPEAFRAFVKTEIEKVHQLVQRAGLKAE